MSDSRGGLRISKFEGPYLQKADYTVEEALFLEALNKDGNNLANDPGPGNMHFVQLIFQDSFEVRPHTHKTWLSRY